MTSFLQLPGSTVSHILRVWYDTFKLSRDEGLEKRGESVYDNDV